MDSLGASPVMKEHNSRMKEHNRRPAQVTGAWGKENNPNGNGDVNESGRRSSQNIIRKKENRPNCHTELVGVPLLKHDPIYGEYFQMLSEHDIPHHWVTKLMEQKGLDGGVLDLDPNLPLANQIRHGTVHNERSASCNGVVEEVDHSGLFNQAWVDEPLISGVVEAHDHSVLSNQALIEESLGIGTNRLLSTGSKVKNFKAPQFEQLGDKTIGLLNKDGIVECVASQPKKEDEVDKGTLLKDDLKYR